MIIEKIIDIALSFFIFLADKLPEFDFTISSAVFDNAKSIFYGVGYFLPLKLLMPILVFAVAFLQFKIAWAIVLRVKSFVPLLGGA